MTRAIKTLNASASPINQKDVTAIETAFTQYSKDLTSGNMLDAMLNHDELGSFIDQDFPAFQFVVSKHGYVATKEGKGVRITQGTNPDPTWVAADLS